MSRPTPTGPEMAAAGVSHASTAHTRFADEVLCHVDLLYRLALRLTGNAADADDLTQETLMRAYRGHARFELREFGAKPWLVKILHHTYLTRAGHAAKETTLLNDVDFDSFAAELERAPLPQLVDGQLDWEGFDDELRTAVTSLAPEYRSVLLMWALGDLTYREIAKILGVAIGTVMSRLYRARQALGESLAEYADRYRHRQPVAHSAPRVMRGTA